MKKEQETLFNAIQQLERTTSKQALSGEGEALPEELKISLFDALFGDGRCAWSMETVQEICEWYNSLNSFQWIVLEYDIATVISALCEYKKAMIKE